LSLPKFCDREVQNVAQFPWDSDSYFLVKNVPESIKLPLAKNAVIDGYTSQWLDTVCKDLTGSEQFRHDCRAIMGARNLG
jgi:hypothetical protein